MTIQDVSYLPSMLTRLLDVSLACLTDTPTGAPAESGLYHGAPPADCCDGLYVWLESMHATKGFPGAWGGPTNCGELVPVAKVAIRLYRPCWPTLKDSAYKPFPPSSESDIAAANLQMDAIKLFCCIMGDISGYDGTTFGGEPLKAHIGTMDPISPKGGCAGWTLHVDLELAPCCL